MHDGVYIMSTYKINSHDGVYIMSTYKINSNLLYHSSICKGNLFLSRITISKTKYFERIGCIHLSQLTAGRRDSLIKEARPTHSGM